MNLTQALQTSILALGTKGIEDNYHEARILLQHVANLSASELHARPEQLLTQAEIRHLQQLLERRLRHEPNAYLVEHKEFYGIDFYIDHRVLIPRPETEILVEQALMFAKDYSNQLSCSDRPLIVADIGTGCGAIAVSIALNLPQSKVYATDISSAALEVARCNCEHHNVIGHILLLQGDLLEPLPEPVDLLIGNLPYVKSTDLSGLSPEITNFEPQLALDGGQDGLQHIRRLVAQAEGKVHPNGCILLEIGNEQDNEVLALAKRYLPKAHCELMPDLNGINRVVKVTL